jgi:hypothetical protein
VFGAGSAPVLGRLGQRGGLLAGAWGVPPRGAAAAALVGGSHAAMGGARGYRGNGPTQNTKDNRKRRDRGEPLKKGVLVKAGTAIPPEGVMFLNNLRDVPGAKWDKVRKGRGRGSGKGKTSGRGHNGQKSRSGSNPRIGFEVGLAPLFTTLFITARMVPGTNLTPHGSGGNPSRLSGEKQVQLMSPSTVHVTNLTPPGSECNPARGEGRPRCD